MTPKVATQSEDGGERQPLRVAVEPERLVDERRPARHLAQSDTVAPCFCVDSTSLMNCCASGGETAYVCDGVTM